MPSGFFYFAMALYLDSWTYPPAAIQPKTKNLLIIALHTLKVGQTFSVQPFRLSKDETA